MLDATAVARQHQTTTALLNKLHMRLPLFAPPTPTRKRNVVNLNHCISNADLLRMEQNWKFHEFEECKESKTSRKQAMRAIQNYHNNNILNINANTEDESENNRNHHFDNRRSITKIFRFGKRSWQSDAFGVEMNNRKLFVMRFPKHLPARKNTKYETQILPLLHKYFTTTTKTGTQQRQRAMPRSTLNIPNLEYICNEFVGYECIGDGTLDKFGLEEQLEIFTNPYNLQLVNRFLHELHSFPLLDIFMPPETKCQQLSNSENGTANGVFLRDKDGSFNSNRYRMRNAWKDLHVWIKDAKVSLQNLQVLYHLFSNGDGDENDDAQQQSQSVDFINTQNKTIISDAILCELREILKPSHLQLMHFLIESIEMNVQELQALHTLETSADFALIHGDLAFNHLTYRYSDSTLNSNSNTDSNVSPFSRTDTQTQTCNHKNMVEIDGVIDWGNAVINDPALEWCLIWPFFGGIQEIVSDADYYPPCVRNNRDAWLTRVNVYGILTLIERLDFDIRDHNLHFVKHKLKVLETMADMNIRQTLFPWKEI